MPTFATAIRSAARWARGVLGQDEAAEHVARVGLLGAIELQDGRERPRRLGARDRLPRVELERVVGRVVVEAKAELARDHLAAEARPRPQARALRLRLHGLGDVAHPELLDQQRVEARDRHVPAPDADRRHSETRAQRRERVVELAALEPLRAAEPAAGKRREHTGLAHHPLRDRVPAAEAAHRAR